MAGTDHAHVAFAGFFVLPKLGAAFGQVSFEARHAHPAPRPTQRHLAPRLLRELMHGHAFVPEADLAIWWDVAGERQQGRGGKYCAGRRRSGGGGSRSVSRSGGRGGGWWCRAGCHPLCGCEGWGMVRVSVSVRSKSTCRPTPFISMHSRRARGASRHHHDSRMHFCTDARCLDS